MATNRLTMNITFTGHVDHGKSTIIGRLLADTDSLPQGRLEKIKDSCRKNSKPFEYAFLLDALSDEQSQGITIDSARVFFHTDKRNYIIIDSPGHIEFLKNMVSGASRAEAAFLVIDAFEGIQENSKRHGYLLSMLGINQICVLVNKMDLVNYSHQVYRRIVRQYSRFLRGINIRRVSFIPVSGREGDNLAYVSNKMPWYKGKTLLKTLDRFKNRKPLDKLPLRMTVQDVYKFTNFGDTRRIIAGNIETGSLELGDEILFLPAGKKARVKSIETFNSPTKTRVSAGYSTGITLEEQIYVSRGHVISKPGEKIPELANRLLVNLFWLGKEPMVLEKEYVFKLGNGSYIVQLEQINKIIDAADLGIKTRRERIERHDVAEAILKINRTVAVDRATEFPITSRFVLVDEYEIAGGGIILEPLEDRQTEARDSILLRNLKWETGNISESDRQKQLGHKSAVVLITGKKDSGKRNIAKELEAELFRRHIHPYYLGIRSLLYGVDADIKKNPVIKRRNERFREEHIRRLAEVSHIMTNAGIILIITAAELNYNDVETMKLAIGPEKLVIFWIGDEISTDLAYDYQIRSNEDRSVSIERIITALEKRSFLLDHIEESNEARLSYTGTEYSLRSLGRGTFLMDNALILEDRECPSPSFLRTEYAVKQLHLRNEQYGFYKFADWLPIRRILPGSSAPVSYKSDTLARHLGLSNLCVTFSGYWPEKSAWMKSCTFKECEAYSVCARLPENFNDVLVVASAGNTARSFARVCSDNGIPLLLIVPEANIDSLWFDKPIADWVKLVAVDQDCDYFDAIHLSRLVCRHEGFMAEGGAKNVARRDGMGTTVLSAATTIGEIPDYYFQAVGSGTGAIAAWEANMRLTLDGRFGSKKMRLMVSQNAPFLIIYESWKRGSRELIEITPELAKRQLDEIKAKVLSNRYPPYSITGGLYDALTDTGGDVIPVSNKEADEAGALFLESEGIDLSPAAAVALASLKKSVEEGSIDRDKLVMLNITGGGEKRFKADHSLHYLKPKVIIQHDELPSDNSIEKIKDLFRGEKIGSI